LPLFPRCWLVDIQRLERANAFRYESLISIENPSGHAVRKQPVYDIFFVSVPR